MRDRTLPAGTYAAVLTLRHEKGQPSTLVANGIEFVVKLKPRPGPRVYSPRPDSTPDLALRYLRQHGPQRHAALCRAIGVGRHALHGCCGAAIRHGAMFLRDGLWRVPVAPLVVVRAA